MGEILVGILVLFFLFRALRWIGALLSDGSDWEWKATLLMVVIAWGYIHGPGSSPPPRHFLSRLAKNQMPVSINGSGCHNLNVPCTRITLCVPHTTHCQTLSGILVDSGDTGVRISEKSLHLSLPNVDLNSPRFECTTYQEHSARWGPVVRATVILAHEPPVTVPVHLYRHTNRDLCGKGMKIPAHPFNGSLGVAPLITDCGRECSRHRRNRRYFTCRHTLCRETALPLSQQVVCPIVRLPEDNNGFVLSFGNVPKDGTRRVDGTLTLGIGTRENSVPTPKTVTLFHTDPEGELLTRYHGVRGKGVLDTGTNFYLLPKGSFLRNERSGCFQPEGDGLFFKCPRRKERAIIEGIHGRHRREVTFTLTSEREIFRRANHQNVLATDSWGGSYRNENSFTWGMPFFYGRKVYFGFPGYDSVLGKGPYVAF